jgi:rRNA maturation endonuclease Nob1
MSNSNLNCIACPHTITPDDIEDKVCRACGTRFTFSTQEEAEKFALDYLDRDQKADYND